MKNGFAPLSGASFSPLMEQSDFPPKDRVMPRYGILPNIRSSAYERKRQSSVPYGHFDPFRNSRVEGRLSYVAMGSKSLAGSYRIHSLLDVTGWVGRNR